MTDPGADVFLELFAPGPTLREGRRIITPTRRKDLALLVFLVIEAGKDHDRGYLAGLLWAETTEARARHSLGQALGRLRALLGEDAIEFDGSRVRLVREIGSDARVLAEAIAHRAPFSGDLVRSDFLASFSPGAGSEAFEDWAAARRADYRREILRLLDELGAAAEARGQWGEALQLAMRQAGIEPSSESACRRQMRSWAALGERTLALRHFDEWTRWLKREFGTAPEEETRALRASLLVSAPAPTAVPPSVTPRPWRAPRLTARRFGFQPSSLMASVSALVISAVAIGAALRDDDGGLSEVLRERGGIVFLSDRSGDTTSWFLDPISGWVDRLEPEEVPPLPDDKSSPDGRYRMVTQFREGGTRAVFLVDLRTDDTTLVSAPAVDEVFDAWAPDGSAYLTTEFREGRGDILLRRPGIGQPIRLTGRDASDDQAMWSPDGRAIAFRSDRGGMRELWIMDADGARPRRLAEGLEPACCTFSPDSRWVLFWNRRPPDQGHYIVRTDGTDLRRLPDAQESPQWSPDGRWLIYAAADETAGEVFRYSVDTGESENLTRSPAHDAAPRWYSPPRLPPIVRVRIVHRVTGSFVPGERRRFHAHAHGPDRQRVHQPPFRWESTDTSVLSVDTAGLVTAMSPGQARIIASAGGWRADTITLLVESRYGSLLFFDDFEHDGLSDRWQLFGSPKPYVARGLGHGGGSGFVNAGDHLFYSGAVSRQHFDATRGLTLEFRARTPIDAAAHQELSVHLLAVDSAEVVAHDEDFGFSNVQLRVFAEMIVVPVQPGRPDIGLNRVRVPFPEDLDPAEWHDYRLMLRADRWAELFIDGRRIAAAPPLDRIDEDAHVRILLGRRSLDTRLVHDDVRLYEGWRTLSWSDSGSRH